ncbi:WPP domain-associated protein-like isoform X2 [Triticum urartu]|uniref:WPP domain-associated protein n=1 Tax=Triticum urartu TaxID=4572 RepID=A0A8R7Q8H1_TRIUA|nr:WPP domain-associated protein-like isoform X2 [Triticum urartu]
MAPAPPAAEQPLEHELQQELSSIMLQGYITGLRREFETKLCENHNHISTLSKSCKENLSEITALRDELNCILTAAAALESTLLPHHNNLEKAEETNSLKMKDDNDIPDFSLLKHMHGEELMTFLKSEWLKSRRQHEYELQQTTEELFRLKRHLAKDGAVLPFRKERELEFIKSKLLQTISKMDGIISRKEGSGSHYNEDDELCRLKDRIGSLLDENEHLRGLLSDKRNEAKQLSAQVVDAQSNVAQRSLSESKLCDELQDLKIESHLKELLELSVLREVFGSYENQIDDHNQEECFLRELLMEKEERLLTMSGDKRKLKYENDQLVSIVGSKLVQHHEEFDLVNDELTMFREKVCEQELLILEFKGESSSMKSCLDEAIQQIHVCKQEIVGLTESLASMSVALEEAKEQNALLDATIWEMKRTAAPRTDGHIGDDAGPLEQFTLVSMEKLSKAYSDFESRLAQSMKQNDIRLTRIIRRFNPLVQQVAVLKKKEFWYKQILEIKCSNLEKAEAEVDVLGDEVETLLSVLGKIYIALDHYSPVLKHYPGVTEILNVAHKVLKGESIEQYNTLLKH